MNEHIHPIFEEMVSRADREAKLNQHSRVLWLTGLSGSGKSTIALAVEKELMNLGYFAQILDGDNIRNGICNNLGFSEADRLENIRRIAEVAKLYVHSGIIAICSFISPTRQIRANAKSIIGQDDFVEIFVDTPLEICESRDVKGLYRLARAGKIKHFTGIDSPYEHPLKPDVHLQTEQVSIAQARDLIIAHMLPQINYRIKDR